jgi:hypothetical protein
VTLAVAAIFVFVPSLWERVSVFMEIVNAAQAEDAIDGELGIVLISNPRTKRSVIVLISLVAAPWVGLTLAKSLTAGQSTENIVVGAILAALVPLSTDHKRSFKTAIVLTIAVMLYLITESGPVTRGAFIALASWFLLLAGAREALTIASYFWSRWRPINPFKRYIPIPPKIWSLLLVGFSIYALVAGGRALLTWNGEPAA